MKFYSEKSQSALDSCHPDLKTIFTEALQIMDHTILEGYRSSDRQHELFLEKKTKVRLGKHNSTPSRAVDAIPYPINWEDHKRMYLFAGIVLAVAHNLGIKIRWGGDWDGDTEVLDNTFNDLVHFELVDDR